MLRLFQRFESNTVFTEEDSWLLFTIAAVAEAFGWTMLLIGIYLSRFIFVHNQVPVIIAGRFHGMLFLLYVVTVLGLYPTLKWSYFKVLCALLVSVVPYGSIIYGTWLSYQRSHDDLLRFRTVIILNHHLTNL